MSSPVINNNYIVSSTRQGLSARDIVTNPDLLKWAENYGKRTLSYDDYFLRDCQLWTGKISANKPVTVACLSVIDPHTNRGIIGLLNDSSGGNVLGNEFKARFETALYSELKKAGINAAIYDNRVEFVIALEGNVDPKEMSSLFGKAIDQVNPEFKDILNGRSRTIRLFEKDRMPPKVKFGYSAVESACSAEELKAVTDKVFNKVKSKNYGPCDFKALLENIIANEPHKIQNVKFVDANWPLVEKNWNNYKFAFYECVEQLPDDFEAKINRSLENYGTNIDQQTKEYLILRNRQLYVNEPTGAFNKTAFVKAAGKALTEKTGDVWVGGGDVYNLGGMDKSLGSATTDFVLKASFDTWKDVAKKFNVDLDIFRLGGDEVAYIIKGADADVMVKMNQAVHEVMNSKEILPPEMLSKVPENELKMLLKEGIIEKAGGGSIKTKGIKIGEFTRKYAKIKGVATKGWQYSFFAEKISTNEKRLDPEHFKEWLMKKSSDHANKVYSETSVVLKQDSGFIVMGPKGIEYFQDYSLHKIKLSSDNIKAVKNIIIKDPKAQLVSKNMLSPDMLVETYRLSDGKEVTIKMEKLKDRIEIQTDKNLIKLKNATNPASESINLNKQLFKNSEDIYKRIDEMKAKGWSDSQILGDAINKLEQAGQAKYVAQVKLLNKLGKIAAPLGVAAMLYGMHMINTAPIEKRGELFAGFVSGFGAFMAGARWGFKATPGNPLWKAGGGLVLGTAFAVIGDSGMKSFIDANPKIKEVFESKKCQALMYALQFIDPIFYLGEIKDAIFGTEYQQKKAFVAKYGPKAWDEKIDNELRPLKEKLAVITEKINNPESLIKGYLKGKEVPDGKQIDGKDLEKYFIGLTREYSKLALEINELEPKKYNIDRKFFNSESYYQKVLDRIQREAQTGHVTGAVEG